MHTCIHAYMHTCIHAYMHRFNPPRSHWLSVPNHGPGQAPPKGAPVPNHGLIHAYMHTCMHAHLHTCMHVYMHTCIHAYMHESDPIRSGSIRIDLVRFNSIAPIRSGPNRFDPIGLSARETKPMETKPMDRYTDLGPDSPPTRGGANRGGTDRETKSGDKTVGSIHGFGA